MLQIVRCDSGAVYNQSTKKVARQGLFQVTKVYFRGGNGEVKREQSQTCLDSAEQASHLKA
jgi:hypothetical protein